MFIDRETWARLSALAKWMLLGAGWRPSPGPRTRVARAKLGVTR